MAKGAYSGEKLTCPRKGTRSRKLVAQKACFGLFSVASFPRRAGQPKPAREKVSGRKPAGDPHPLGPAEIKLGPTFSILLPRPIPPNGSAWVAGFFLLRAQIF